MTDTDDTYIHGYTLEEQQRLVDQARYWRDKLILRKLDYRPGQSVLVRLKWTTPVTVRLGTIQIYGQIRTVPGFGFADDDSARFP